MTHVINITFSDSFTSLKVIYDDIPPSPSFFGHIIPLQNEQVARFLNDLRLI